MSTKNKRKAQGEKSSATPNKRTASLSASTMASPDKAAMLALFPVDESLISVSMEEVFPKTKRIPDEKTLHVVMANLLVREFGDCFDSGIFEVKRSPPNRWVIAKHKVKGWCLELQCECPRIKRAATMMGFTREEANLRLPPGKDHPDVMISLFFPESDIRLPLWIIDWKVNHPPVDQWGQAHAYGFQALRYNRSVLSNFDCVRTSIMDHETDFLGGLLAATWNISVDNFQFQTSPYKECPNEFPQFIREVCAWCTSKAELVIGQNEKPGPFRGVRWFPTLVFPPEAKDKGFVSGEFQPNQSDRSTIFKCAKDGKVYWAKYLIKDSLGFETTLARQQHLYAFMQTELSNMHETELQGMLPFRELFTCSNQVALEITEDIEATNPCGADMTAQQIVKFIFRMLAMTQIDFKKIGEYFVWHADLRPSNVNAKGQVIDFEFLGRGARRVGDNPEITNEQRAGNMSERTAAWQIAILLVCVFADDGPETAKQICEARRKDSTRDIPLALNSIKSDPLRGVVHDMIREFSDLRVFCVSSAHKPAICAELKAQYDKFKHFVDVGMDAVEAAWKAVEAKNAAKSEAIQVAEAKKAAEETAADEGDDTEDEGDAKQEEEEEEEAVEAVQDIKDDATYAEAKPAGKGGKPAKMADAVKVEKSSAEAVKPPSTAAKPSAPSTTSAVKAPSTTSAAKAPSTTSAAKASAVKAPSTTSAAKAPSTSAVKPSGKK